MNKNQKSMLILFLAFVILLGSALLIRYMNRVRLYDDESTVGNTSGNLLNGGLFCESDGVIYFSNPYDEGMLYSMNQDLEKVKKLSDDNVSYLNVAGKYIFYTKRNDKKNVDSDFFMALSTTGLYRTNLKGGSISSLYKEPTQVACLYGNNVYYQHYDQEKGLQLYAAKIDGSEDKKLLDEPCAPFAVAINTTYYAGYNGNHAIHTLNINGTGDSVLYDGNCTSVTLHGEYIYFMDMNDNYALKRIPVTGGTPEALVSDRLATYNVSEDGNTVYCQIDNGTDNGLYSLDINSKSLQLIASGNYNYLNLTSNYLFYEEFDQSKLYILDLASGSTKEWDWEKK